MNNREIDRLVAEKVMNAKFNDGEIFKIILENGNKYTNFSPSTDIQHAWEVLERIETNHFYNWQIESTTLKNNDTYYDVTIEEHYYVKGYLHFTSHLSTEKSVPLAICKAALKTVGIEVDE